MKNKNPLIIISSLLGLTVATASFAAVTPPASTGQVMTNGKPQLWQKGDNGQHKGWNKKEGDYDKRGEHKGMDGMMGKGMKGLDLTATQQAQFEQLRVQNQAKMAQFKAQLSQIDANIATQKAAGANTATLLGLYQQKQTVMDQFFVMHQQQRQQVISLLTPEQQLKLYENQGRGHKGFGKDGMKK